MVALWIVFCAFCNCIGWILSALHALNPIGYGVSFGLGILALAIWKARTGEVFFRGQDFLKLRRRLVRPLPAAFSILAALAFLGGALHHPTNYDGLSYREPRALEWLAANRWHWIHSDYARLNVRAAGFEWLSAPLFALTRTDRLVFLINVVSFLMLPGLTFSVFHRLGVRRRVAWHWAWIATTGYCFVLGAGSIANDMFATVFALAAIDFALRARESESIQDLLLSILSVALLTGAKGSNLPLLLPWLIAAGPAFKLLFRRPAVAAAVYLVAGLSSFAPIAIANWQECRDWSGETLETGGSKKDPLFRVPVNTVLILSQNFSPPVFPMAQWWNQFVPAHTPPRLKAKLEGEFEPGGVHLAIGEIETEEHAGIGFGVSVLLLASVIAAMASRCMRVASINRLQWAILGSTWFCLLVLMAKLGLSEIGRVITPYYLLLIPIFLLPRAQEQVIRARWWRFSVAGVFLVAAFLVIISQARPLWPAHFVLEKLHAKYPSDPRLQRASQVFATYAQRWDAFAAVRARLPEELKVVGVITSDDPETSLWRPFGSRRMEHLKLEDSIEDLRKRNIQYVLVNSAVLNKTIEQWTQEMHGEILWKMTLQLKTSAPPKDWYFIRVDSASSKGGSSETPAPEIPKVP